MRIERQEKLLWQKELVSKNSMNSTHQACGICDEIYFSSTFFYYFKLKAFFKSRNNNHQQVKKKILLNSSSSEKISKQVAVVEGQNHLIFFKFLHLQIHAKSHNFLHKREVVDGDIIRSKEYTLGAKSSSSNKKEKKEL